MKHMQSCHFSTCSESYKVFSGLDSLRIYTHIVVSVQRTIRFGGRVSLLSAVSSFWELSEAKRMFCQRNTRQGEIATLTPRPMPIHRGCQLLFSSASNSTSVPGRLLCQRSEKLTAELSPPLSLRPHVVLRECSDFRSTYLFVMLPKTY